MGDLAPLKFIQPGGCDLIFAGNPLDRAEALREDEDRLLHMMCQPTSRAVLFDSGKALMTVEPELDIDVLAGDKAASLLTADAPWVFLGVIDEEHWFAFDVTDVPQADISDVSSASSKLIDLRSIAIGFAEPVNDKGRAAILAEAKALLGWHRRHRCCSTCGTATESRNGGFLRRCVGAACGAEHFPRTDPVVIMLILSGEECLVGRQAQFDENVYSALAGFMEPGESIEEAVRREVLEEAGITVGEVRYFASQPWPFPSSLMIGCFGEALNRDITVDPRELEDARWISRENVHHILAGEASDIRVPPAMAIAHQLLRHWASGGE